MNAITNEKKLRITIMYIIKEISGDIVSMKQEKTVIY